MDVAPPPVSSSSVAEALTPRQIGLILFALTLGGFAIGTSEFASMAATDDTTNSAMPTRYTRR